MICWALRRARQGIPRSLSTPHEWHPQSAPDIGYAMIFPSATIVKVIAVQIIGLILLGG